MDYFDWNLLFEEICTLVFRYEDGSIVCSLISLNEDILKRYGLGTDRLYDLAEQKPIPVEMFRYCIGIDRGDTREKYGSKLDKIFERGVKVWWN